MAELVQVYIVYDERLLILVGAGGREWLEGHAIDTPATPEKNEFQPIGKIWHIVPKGPLDPNSLIDACIAFAPKLFEDCPTLEDVKASLKDDTMLDFDLRKEDIPAKWSKLREEARPIFEKLTILKGELQFHPPSSGR